MKKQNVITNTKIPGSILYLMSKLIELLPSPMFPQIL